MIYDILSGEGYYEILAGGVAVLGSDRQRINDLNVFPIPDGDTGDNMYMTLDAGVAAVKYHKNETLGEVSDTISHGMLLGARGNSGVILSRIFAGIAKGLAGKTETDVAGFVEALHSGVTEAYASVTKPVEGTILTVIREGVAFADGHTDKDFSGYFDILIDGMEKSLENTPELLAVLKEAGVVDSGGAGLVSIFKGMMDVLNGHAPVSDSENVGNTKVGVDVTLFDENSVLEYGYCTEFLLRLQNSKINAEAFDENIIVDYLMSVGESVVAIRDGSILKVHVHTERPGEILNECQKYGEFLTLKIENMTLQHNGTSTKNEKRETVRKRKKYAVTAVAAGDGIKENLRSCGVDAIVDGGQSMNPSAQSIIQAIKDANAETVFIFPNNGNVILTAKQACDIYHADGGESHTVIIPTKSIGEGYAAITAFDTSSGDTERIVSEVTEAIADVTVGMVSKTNRAAVTDGLQIDAGEYIGFTDSEIMTKADDAESALVNLAEHLGAGGRDIILLLCGKDADENKAQAVYSELEKKYRRSEVIMIDGGQPIYDYIIVLE